MNERVQLLQTKDETILENLHDLNGKVKQIEAHQPESLTSEIPDLEGLEPKKPNTRNIRSVMEDSLKHAISLCKGAGQLSTFYYPDHPDTPQLEIGNDAMTTIALGENGIGPSNCEDLQAIGYTLKGFYAVRVTKKRMRNVYCESNTPLKK